MSLLAPLYFAGALAIGLPILFHMVRRRPRGEVKFSSLMFLRPTPPKLTRRSRLDNWLLLLIRALALLLLAAAFTRPFLRSSTKSDADLPSRRMVIAVDTSASMRRDGLWEQAQVKIEEVLSDLRPGDEIALVAFDDTPRTLLRFDRSNRLSPPQVRTSVKSLLADLQPSWAATDLGRALGFAADLAVTYEPQVSPESSSTSQDSPAVAASSASGPAQLIFVTDMQTGSKIESLQGYAWPKQLSLDIRQVSTDRKTNAVAQLLPPRKNAPAEKTGVRVRVSNSADADQSAFLISWTDRDGQRIEGSEMPIQVPPGESRVMRMQSPAPDATALTLHGDDQDFDNSWYVVSPQPESLQLLHLGDDAADPRSSLLYYLQRVPLSTRQRSVATQTMPPDDLTQAPDPNLVPLVVVTAPCSPDTAALLHEYITAGGRLLCVLAGDREIPTAMASLQSLTRVDDLRVTEAAVDDYVMLSRIDFRHPIFAAMSDPQFNDFTKIRFWSHRTLSGIPGSWDVLARFDDEDPALVEQTIGMGQLWVLAAGWQPEASQLALSTKFIPLIFSLFESNARSLQDSNQLAVGDKPSLEPSPTARITLPDGAELAYREAADLQTFAWPGIYAVADDDLSQTLAVNLDNAESQTATMGADALERFGVRLGATLSTADELSNQRQLHDRELESRQRLWQWLLVAALALLGLETFLGGWLSRPRPAAPEVSPS
ncbi:vWA domain-containing protein [Allorhodopirellula solitaria]|uniref:VWFA domain-containing protein n=1 Tax=Allorhodopirellula solitaria TaxID=2527987 RepID=A0A5C5YKT1_9BACT|nr:BatA domain-containing protein [Allorhodopirellula solitaria]TWT75388.1 hypothetical protein CA85_06790 [Allorhodopirellula solitaria]